MNQNQKIRCKQEYMDWLSGENFGLRLDVASGKYNETRLVELFSKYIKTKVNDRCFGRRKWYSYSESEVINFHGFKEGKKIRSIDLNGYFRKGGVTNNYVKTLNHVTSERRFNINEDGEILNYENDKDFKNRYFYEHLTVDSDDLVIRKQLRNKHTDTEEHYHFSVWLPDYIRYTTYEDTDYSNDYQLLVGWHLRDIINEYNDKQIHQTKYGNRKNIFLLDIQIHTYNEINTSGKYYSSKKLQMGETNETLDRRYII